VPGGDAAGHVGSLRQDQEIDQASRERVERGRRVDAPGADVVTGGVQERVGSGVVAEPLLRLAERATMLT
jgi:hypothetical protein